MFEIKNKMIYITKGDSAAIKVDLENADGTEYTMQSGDTLTFTVRKKPSSPVLMQTTSSTNTLNLKPTNTKNLEVGYCCFDIELKTSSGDVFTVVGIDMYQNNNMLVLPEITE